VTFIKENKWYFVLSFLFCAISLFFVWDDNWIIYLIPLALLGIYAILFYTEFTFLSLFFLAPLSFNIEEFTESFGLFIPTEPILMTLMLLVLFLEIKFKIIPKFLWKSQFIWIILIYISWLFITSITSSNPLVSFKFLLAKLWFIVPVFSFGSVIFQNYKNIRRFLWLFISGMILVMIYTLIHHASYQFGEKESHWVMSPFFKDHTIYGALVAFTLPLIVGLYFSKKNDALIQAVLIGFFSVNLIALYFSYTRAAWLSIIIALIVFFLIKIRIKFSILVSVTIFLGLTIFFSWTSIQQSLAKNKAEHTTEEFGKRLESVSNVTTDASNLERLNRWQCAWDMFSERPIFGYGPGTYAFEYARFQRPENLTIISTNFGDGGNAHSEYLGPLAETGFIGFIIIIVLVFSIFYLGITTYYKIYNKNKEMRIIVLALILALVTYFFHGLLNNYLDTDKAAVPIWSICAVFLVLNWEMEFEKKQI
jgi:putative inorganic carbon (HCO3(-)) transporter